MILDKEVQMKVHNRTAKKYEDKGYKIPMCIGTKGNLRYDTSKYFTVKIEDVEPTSTVMITTVCDGENCDYTAKMQYRDYFRRLNSDGKKYCNKCKIKRCKETMLERYNVESASQLDWVKEKNKRDK